MARRSFDDVASRRAREIRVVQDDAPRARAECLVERVGDVAERSSALVAVEAEVPARHVVLRDSGLPGSGDAHDEHDVGVGLRSSRRSGARSAERSIERFAVAGLEDERAGARSRACGLGSAGAGDGNHHRRELEQPGERDLGRRRAVCVGHLGDVLVACDPARALGPTERRVREHRDACFVAALDDSTAECAVVVRAERDLDCSDRSELERFVQLRAVDVRDPDVLHEAVVDESRERANRGSPGRPRVRRVDEVEVDRQPVEGDEARFAVGTDRLRATVGNPTAVESAHASLRHDPSVPLCPGAAECAREPGLVLPVGACGVEDADAGFGSGRDRLERAAPRFGSRPSTAACSRGRCGAPARRATRTRLEPEHQLVLPGDLGAAERPQRGVHGVAGRAVHVAQ